MTDQYVGGSSGVPAVLEEWISRWAPARGEDDGASRIDRALAALEQARSRPGRNRDAAEALLVADALLTATLEDMVGSGNPEARLLEVLALVGARADTRGGAE